MTQDPKDFVKRPNPIAGQRDYLLTPGDLPPGAGVWWYGTIYIPTVSLKPPPPSEGEGEE